MSEETILLDFLQNDFLFVHFLFYFNLIFLVWFYYFFFYNYFKWNNRFFDNAIGREQFLLICLFIKNILMEHICIFFFYKRNGHKTTKYTTLLNDIFCNLFCFFQSHTCHFNPSSLQCNMENSLFPKDCLHFFQFFFYVFIYHNLWFWCRNNL